MSQENLFREVDEDMERQKLEALWKRYGIFVIAGVMAAIIGTSANSYIQSSKIKTERKATGELINILSDSKADQDKKITSLLAFTDDNKGKIQATLSAFHAAALASKNNSKDKAIKIYDSIAADAKADHGFRQLADLLSVEQQMDAGDVAQMQKRLEPLMAEKEPWRFAAMEISAHLAIRAGNKTKAKELFTNLSQDASVPKSLSERASDMLRLLSE